MIRIYISIIVILGLCCCQQISTESKIGNAHSVSKGVNPINPKDTLLNDTLFILREQTSDTYHAVYIEKNRSSKYYKWLTDFKFDEYDEQGLIANYDAMNEVQPHIFKKYKKYGLPKDWIPLYSYKKQFYLYAPSDWGNAGRRIICDSALLFWYMDGLYPKPIKEIKKMNNKEFHLIGYDLNNGNKPTIELIIHIINQETMISLWEFPAESDAYRYQVYIPKEYANRFDMVVNFCETKKTMEFEFDEIDYKKLKVSGR